MVVGSDSARVGDDPHPSGDSPRAGQRWPAGTAIVLGLVSVVAALALPFAAVSMNEPRVSWPADPAAPRSTMLMLTAYRPLAIDAAFSCRDARSVAPTPESPVLATTRPGSPRGAAAGLVASVADGVLSVTSRGVVMAQEPIGGAPCRFTLTGSGDSVVLARDGRELGRGPMPDVDALVTSVTVPPGATTDLRVRLTVDDRFSTSPSPTKIVLLVVAALSACGAVRLLVVADRRERTRSGAPVRPAGLQRTGLLAVGVAVAVDVVVVGALGAWLFLAPLTPDDGYYSAMARNVPFEGYVGNYYQLFNQGFVPFSWIYQALAGWQQLVGLAPVALRVPALVCGLLTWLSLRRLVVATRRDTSDALAPATSRRGVLTTAVLGVAFLAWWMPFGMGVRPEPVVALAAVATLLCVLLASERRSLLLAGTAVGVASLGATAAPSGLAALAPLVAGLPSLARLLTGNGGRLDVLGRTLCVLSPGVVGAVAAFGDGSWRDFVRAQEILNSVQEFESWYTEYLRWQSVLEAASSAYAPRAAVLVTALVLFGFLLLWAAGKARMRPLPARLVMSGMTVAFAFLLLSPTPSKPWMHFGALAGVGAAFLALMVVEGPRGLREFSEGRRVPRAAVLTAVGAVVSVLALAGRGDNSWWIATWSPRLPQPGPPRVGIFRFDQPLWWLLGVLVVAVGVFLIARRRSPTWTRFAPVLALSTVVTVFLAATVTYMLGTFGLEAARTAQSWSIPAQNLRDPFASECGAGSQVEAADPVGPPLTPDPRTPSPLPPSEGFGANRGWFEASPPPLPPSPPPTVVGWGSRVVDPADPAALREETTGNLTTPWLTLPPGGPDRAVTSLVSGRTGDGNSLTVEFGRVTPDGVVVLGARRLGESDDPSRSVSSTAWRSVDLASRDAAPPAGTQVLRLVAVDGRTDVGGWIAFTSPRMGRFVPVDDIVAGGAPTALSWQIALLFPCVRQPRVHDGITEPVRWGVGYGDDPLELLRDGTWQPGRGGLFGQTGRQAAITQLVARFRDAPAVYPVQVYRFDQPYDAEAYIVAPHQRVVPGWQVRPPTS